MNWRNTSTRYGSLLIALHWLMLVLLAAVAAFMELRGMFPKGSAPREAMKSWHYMFGMLVLGLALVRLAVRMSGPIPAISPAPARWQQVLAALVKLGLYGVMLGMPLLGWALLSASGEPVPFFAWQLPPLMGPDHALAEVLEELHEAGATLAYALVGMHTAAALYHHYVVRDDTLRRILPRR